MAGTGEVAITSTLSIVQLERLDSHYKPGIPLFGQVRPAEGTRPPAGGKAPRSPLPCQATGLQATWLQTLEKAPLLPRGLARAKGL